MAVAGAGTWGRNHVRALASLPGARLDWVADPSAARRAEAREMAPRARVVADLGRALADPHLDAVVIASPSPTHAPLARDVLAAGKHVLVEKPLAPTSAEAWDLVRRARRAKRLLGVGHLLLYHPGVRALRRAVTNGRIGSVHYLHGQRTNLGRIRDDEGALFSLAPHDVSVMVHLLGRWPIGVAARGAVCAQPRFEDVAFLILRFPGGVLGHVHLSWLDPLKVRRISVVGSRGMAVLDDMRTDQKLRLIRRKRGATGPSPARATSVRLSAQEPLREELKAFVRSVRTGAALPTPGEDGARVVRVLEAAQRSLARGGQEVPVRIR